MRWRGFLGLIGVALCACESPLDLESVEKTREQAVRRYDQFQAAAATGNTLVVVGGEGVVLTADRTTPLHWQRRQLDGKPSLIDVAACPNGQFAAVDFQGTVWLSQADDSWRAAPVDSRETPQALTCDTQNTLWVVAGFGTILNTRDAGQTWHTYSLEEDLFLTSIQFVDARTGYVTGEFGTVLKTTDGGATWGPLTPLTDDLYPMAAYFNDRGEGWVVGLKGIVLHTADDGHSWSVQETPTEAPLYGLAGKDGDLYAVGEQGVLLRLQGNRWFQIHYGAPLRFYLRALLPVDDGLLMAGGAGALNMLDAALLRDGSL